MFSMDQCWPVETVLTQWFQLFVGCMCCMWTSWLLLSSRTVSWYWKAELNCMNELFSNSDHKIINIAWFDLQVSVQYCLPRMNWTVASRYWTILDYIDHFNPPAHCFWFHGDNNTLLIQWVGLVWNSIRYYYHYIDINSLYPF